MTTEIEDHFNYVLLKMGYKENDVGPTLVAFTINELNIKTLVGEFKILIDRLRNNLPLTQQEFEEHMYVVKKWEEDLYGY